MSTEEYSIGYADGKRDGYNEGVVDGHQAATSRQDAKIQALVAALELVASAETSALDLAYVKGVAKAALTNHAAKETP